MYGRKHSPETIEKMRLSRQRNLMKKIEGELVVG